MEWLIYIGFVLLGLLASFCIFGFFYVVSTWHRPAIESYIPIAQTIRDSEGKIERLIFPCGCQLIQGSKIAPKIFAMQLDMECCREGCSDQVPFEDR